MRLRTPSGLSVLLCDEIEERGDMFEGMLRENGYAVARAGASTDIPATVAAQNPDMMIVNTTRPDSDLLATIKTVQDRAPRPVALFAEDGDRETMRAAVAAGVSAFIVIGLSANRVRSAIDLAMVQFEETNALKAQLDKATLALHERKLVERAKSILMSRRAMDEETAHRTLQKRAMERNVRIAEIARTVIEAQEIMG